MVGRLEPALPHASWTRPQAWHLTLKFLGEIDENAAARFSAAIEDAAAAASEGDVASGGGVVLPPRGRPRVLGVGFAPGAGFESLARLAAKAELAAVRIGVAPDGRPFHPHVTLARLRDPWPAAAVGAFRNEADRWVFPAWRVRSCVLYRSRLDPSGAVHTPLREWRMSAGAAEVRA
jgi:2'-5' RNA ligase